MAQSDNKQPAGILRSLDWWTIGIYLALLCFGWISVCGASYTYGDNDIFSLGARSGMQIIWIGTSIALGFVILMMDDRFFDTFAYVIYAVLILLLLPRYSIRIASRVRTPGWCWDRCDCSLPSSVSLLRRWLWQSLCAAMDSISIR